ncbi:OmpA family protein [Oricola sp.]|uniref:OmpA family protein n=1 Tax=Oricola sp. TaxID=1979950 RepID=UPI003BAC60BA
MNRRSFLTSLAAAGATALVPAMPSLAIADNSPSAAMIQRKLQAAPRFKAMPDARQTIQQLKRNRRIRHMAPSIDIQSINFAFGSARIPASQHWKVEEIGIALNRILNNSPYETFLIEGHTDAVGSYSANQRLSERRAASLAQVLVGSFGVPRRSLQTVGYGETELLVPTPHANWRNRRVTLRRVTDFVILR